MLLDLIFIIILTLAVIKGYQRGLIVGVFSFAAIIVGLAAAVKLSAVVAGYIGHAVNVSDKWLPVVSFIIVFVMAVLLVRLGANLIQKTAEAAMLGWVNRLGGIIFYAVIYMLVYSVLLFYAEKTGVLTVDSTEHSATYSIVRPWGPRAIDGFGSLIPLFKNMFAELELFFSGVAEKIPEKT